MRSYPRNSPQAAGRLVALALLADGHVCQREIDALRRLDASGRLGLPPDGLPSLLHTLCEDLMAATHAGRHFAALDDEALAALLREVDDPALQCEVLTLIRGAAAADDHLAEGEGAVLDAALRCWRLPAAPLGQPGG